MAVCSLLADHQGALWIGSVDGQVLRLADAQLESMRIPERVRGQVYDIAEEGTNVWVGFGVGLCQYQGRGLSRYLQPPGGYKGSFKRVVERRTHPGQPWVHEHDSLWVLGREGLEAVPPPGNVAEEKVLGITARRAGGLWVAFESGAAWVDEQCRWGPFCRFGGSPVGWAAAMTEDRRGNLWIGTPLRGLFCLSGDGDMRCLLETGEVPFTWIRQVFEDRQGNLFLATDADGLARISLRAFRLWGSRS